MMWKRISIISDPEWMIDMKHRLLKGLMIVCTEAKCITISLLKSNANHLIMNLIGYILRKQSANCTSSGILFLIFIDFIPYQV